MQCKLCYAEKNNDDGSRSSVTVCLRSVFRLPIALRLLFRAFFVIYTYEKDPITGKWHMTFHNTPYNSKLPPPASQESEIIAEPPEPKKNRYEAYLWIKKSIIEP